MQQEKDKEDPQRDKVLGGMVGLGSGYISETKLSQNDSGRKVEILAKNENLFD